MHVGLGAIAFFTVHKVLEINHLMATYFPVLLWFRKRRYHA